MSNYNINLTTKQVQLINSALSVYYSTRADNNPLKDDALNLKQEFLKLNPKLAEQVTWCLTLQMTNLWRNTSKSTQLTIIPLDTLDVQKWHLTQGGPTMKPINYDEELTTYETIEYANEAIWDEDAL